MKNSLKKRRIPEKFDSPSNYGKIKVSYIFDFWVSCQYLIHIFVLITVFYGIGGSICEESKCWMHKSGPLRWIYYVNYHTFWSVSICGVFYFLKFFANIFCRPTCLSLVWSFGGFLKKRLSVFSGWETNTFWFPSWKRILEQKREKSLQQLCTDKRVTGPTRVKVT